MSELIGTQIGQYRIVAPLGKGGMADVFRVQHVQTGQAAALKRIRPELARDPQFVRRFLREAQTLSTLNHPHILRVFEYGQEDGALFLVMELLSGGDLNALMRENALEAAHVARLARQIGAALDYAHSAGIVHRDLKPQNVLLNAAGDAVLTDFGLAKLLNDADRSQLTQTGAQLGTPAYMSPEQWLGENVDARADIYSFGILVFEMLSGQPLFRGESSADLMHKHLYMLPPPISRIRDDLPAATDAVLRRALAKERRERWYSAAAFSEALHNALLNGSLPELDTDALARLPTAIVSPDQAAEQERRALAQLDSDRMRSTPSRIGSRIINPLPQEVGDRFIGRARQLAQISSLVSERARLISLYGRGGVGKTALLCNAINDIQASELALDGIVSLSSSGTGISLEKALLGFSKLLDGEAQNTLEYLARDGQTPPARKAALLLEALVNGRYALLLDSLEALQDAETGALTDPDLAALLETTLERGGMLTIFITSREPLSLPRQLKVWERQIALDEGLPADEAVALLRLFDSDGAVGLREADAATLHALAEMTGGFPRALEATVGLLLEDPLLSPSDLLNDASLISGEVTPLIVQQAISRLSPEAVRVMEALALYGRPVAQPALEFLLAPFMNTAGIRAILSRLVRGYFVSFNKATSQFALHPIDRAYSYQQIPLGQAADTQVSPLPYTRCVLHKRAAAFYEKIRKPRQAWHTLEDLSAPLAEIDHLIAAAHYDDAARLLIAIDVSHLWEWGQFPLLKALHEQLDGKISDPKLARQQRRRIGWLHFLPQVEPAAVIFKENLERARQAGDRQAEADALDDLGQVERGRGNLLEGMAFHEQALAIYREIGDEYGQAEAMGGIGSVLRSINPAAAEPYLHQALVIHQRMGNLPNVAYLLNMLGQCASNNGNFAESLTYYQQILGMTTYSPLNRMWAQIYMSEAYAYLGDYTRAHKLLDEAIATIRLIAPSEEVMQSVLDFANIYRAVVLIFTHDDQTAIQLLKGVLRSAQDGNSPFNLLPATLYLSLALTLHGNVDEACQLIAQFENRDLEFSPLFAAIGSVILMSAHQSEGARAVRQEALEALAKQAPSPANAYAQALTNTVGMLLGESTLEETLSAYQKARQLSSAVGGVVLQQRMIATLRRAHNNNQLAEVEAFLSA